MRHVGSAIWAPDFARRMNGGDTEVPERDKCVIGTSETAQLLAKIKSSYLPELEMLSRELKVLKEKTIGARKGNRDIEDNRLISFASGVNTVIRSITNCVVLPGNTNQLQTLQALETKIANTILPVKQKIHERLASALSACARVGGNVDLKGGRSMPELVAATLAGGKPAGIESAGESARQLIAQKRKAHERKYDALLSEQPSAALVSQSVTSLTTFESSLSGYNTSDSGNGGGSGNGGIGAKMDGRFIEPTMCIEGLLDVESPMPESLMKDPFVPTTMAPPGRSVVDFLNCSVDELLSSDTQMGSGMGMGIDQNRSTGNTPSGDVATATDGDALGNMMALSGSSRPDYDEDYPSSKRRRRLNQIVPWPRKPKLAYYSCSICNEPYHQIVNENPWWAVYVHDCPKCHQSQVPRIDITAPNNAIELDPNVMALYGEGMDDSDEEDFDGDECEDDGDDEHEEKVFDGEGLLQQDEAAKLLVLMAHARTCTGYHSSTKHAEVCKSTKYLMLHIRDCKGVNADGHQCAFPWCSPCKRMLLHLTRCFDSSQCAVCNPWSLSESYQQLKSINQERLEVAAAMPMCLPATAMPTA